MLTIVGLILWFCIDDHLAAAVGAPGIGHIPWWVVLISLLIIELVTWNAND